MRGLSSRFSVGIIVFILITIIDLTTLAALQISETHQHADVTGLQSPRQIYINMSARFELCGRCRELHVRGVPVEAPINAWAGLPPPVSSVKLGIRDNIGYT